MRRLRSASGTACALFLAACTASPPMPAPPPTHPASPLAAEAPVPAATDTLTVPDPAVAPGAPGGR